MAARSRAGALRWIVVAVVPVLASAGCGAPSSPTEPSPAAAGPGPGPSGLVTVVVRGRVIDIDREGPLEGAIVRTDSVLSNGNFVPPNPPAAAATNGAGEFTLVATLPASWSELSVIATREGYEYAFPDYVTQESGTAASAELTLYPTRTLAVGQSIDLPLDFTNNCGFDGEACRRVVLGVPPGTPVEVVLTPLSDQQFIGLTPSSNYFNIETYQKRIVSTTGEVWIVGEPGRVRLTAR